MYHAVSDKDAENAIDAVTNLIGNLFNAFAAAIESAPETVLGWILVILALALVYKKVFD